MGYICREAKNDMKIAVTGVGGGVGQSIMKALQLASIPIQIYPIDINPLSAGLYRGTKSSVLPKPEKPENLKVWEEWLLENKIDALIPGSDHDLLPLAGIRDEWDKRDICRVLISDKELIETGHDKALTNKKFTDAGILAPKSIWNINIEEAINWAGTTGYPIILKPRVSSSSRHLHIIYDEEELSFYFPRTPNPILQEYLHWEGKTFEYTCSVFVDNKSKIIGTFMAKRDLIAGSTYRAEINYWPEIDVLIKAIANLLIPRGPINIQLRQTEKGPMPFEINTRCSGTTAIRAYFGYNEPEMLIRNFVLEEELSPPISRNGYVFRYWNEIFLDGVSEEQLIAGDIEHTGKVIGWP